MATYKNQNTELQNTIARLEFEKQVKLEALKNQFTITTQSLKPLNILKDTFQDFQDSPDLKSNFIKTITSLVGGYLSKKLVFGKSKSLFKNIVGYVLQYGVSNYISKKVNAN